MQVTQEIGGMCYTTKCDMVENGLMECALEANPMLSCNPGTVRRNRSFGGADRCEGKC
jgi:hypothetical protein